MNTPFMLAEHPDFSGSLSRRSPENPLCHRVSTSTHCQYSDHELVFKRCCNCKIKPDGKNKYQQSKGEMKMIKQKILIAEDHAILRQGLCALLSSSPDLEIIGEAEDGHEAVAMARQLQPHTVLMDLTMPNTNGTEAIRAIKRHNPDICIIVLTVHKSEEYVRATLDAGANGYVLKDDTHNDLLNAISSAQKGNIFLSPGICNKVINGYLDTASSAAEPASSSWSQLTVREREITKLIAEGKKSREVAAYLSLSLKTVEKHRTNLMRKLDLHNASAITKYAIENHLVDL